MSQVVPILHFRADRFLYLPSVGFVWVIVCLGEVFFKQQRTMVMLAGAVCLFSVWRVSARVPVFENDLTHYEPLVKKYPNCREGQAFLAQAYLKVGDFDRARTSFAHAMEEKREVHAHVHRPSLYGTYARFLIAQKQYEAAYEILRIQVKPYYQSGAVSNFYLGVCCLNTERWREARSYFERFLSEVPADASGTLLLGRTLLALGETNKALEMFRSYLVLAPQAPDERDVRRVIQELEMK